MKLKNHFSNNVVEHSFGCCSSACLISPTEHCSVFYFDTATDAYHAESIDAAARMWMKDGAKPLIAVGRVG